jgi:hypothetical protein
MRPFVRDLYKRYLLAGRDYPGGMEVVRRKTKEQFMKNKNLKDEVEIRRAVQRGRLVYFALLSLYLYSFGRWYLKNELLGIIQFKKFRVMRSRYDMKVDEPILKPFDAGAPINVGD